MKLFLLCSLLVASLAVSSADPSRHACKTILTNGGLSSRYNETIGHAIHSMTVEGLQLFDPLATEDNGVPTVNKNLADRNNLVLPNAPSDPWQTDFGSKTMNIIDAILSRIGTSDDGLGPHWSPIERIAHVFHMWDLWTTIREEAYPDVVENPPSNQVCDCLRNTKDNGIYASVDWVARHYLVATPITLLDRPIPQLTDSSSWSVWKDRLLHYYKDQDLKDAATFLYCVTHK